MASNLDDLLECSICCLQLVEPKKLPCDHTFCAKCVAQMTADGWITCPDCRKVHNASDVKHDFKTEKFLAALTEQIAHARSTSPLDVADAAATGSVIGRKCELCERRTATQLCEECKQCVCDSCKAIHLKAKSSRSHDVKSLEAVQQQFKSSMREFGNKLQEHIYEYNRAIGLYQQELSKKNEYENSIQ